MAHCNPCEQGLRRCDRSLPCCPSVCLPLKSCYPAILQDFKVVAIWVLFTPTLEILTVCPIYISLLLWNSNVTTPAKSQPVVTLAALPPQGSLFPKDDGDSLHALWKLYAVTHNQYITFESVFANLQGGIIDVTFCKLFFSLILSFWAWSMYAHIHLVCLLVL